MDSFSIKYFMQLRQTNKLCALNFLGRMAGESLHLPCNGVILTHSSKGPELSLRGQSNGKWAYLWRSNVIRLNFCFISNWVSIFQRLFPFRRLWQWTTWWFIQICREFSTQLWSCASQKRGISGKDIHEGTVQTVQDDVQLWVAEIKQGRKSPEDELWPVPSQAATTEEKIAEIHQIIKESQRVTIRIIAQKAGILKEMCHSHNLTGVEYEKIVYTVPTQEADKDQKYRHKMCQVNLQWLWHNSDRFFSWTFIEDEMLFHHFDPETEQQSTQLKHAASLLPNKFRAQVLAGKVMTTIVGCYGGGLLAEKSHYRTWQLLQLTPKPERLCC